MQTGRGRAERAPAGWTEPPPAGQSPHHCILFPQMLDEAIQLAKALERNNPGWVYIHPFDDPLIW